MKGWLACQKKVESILQVRILYILISPMCRKDSGDPGELFRDLFSKRP
jgi:hypothetical protein